MKHLNAILLLTTFLILGSAKAAQAQAEWAYYGGGAIVLTTSTGLSDDENRSDNGIVGTFEGWKAGISITTHGKANDKDVNALIRGEARTYLVYGGEIDSPVLKSAVLSVKKANEAEQKPAIDDQRIIAGIATGRYQFAVKQE